MQLRHRGNTTTNHTMSRQALLHSPGSPSSSRHEVATFTCVLCGFENVLPPTDDDEYSSDEEEAPKVFKEPECKLCRFFDTLLMLSGRAVRPKDLQRLAAKRSSGGEYIRAADIVLAFRLWQFNSSVPDRNLDRTVREDLLLANCGWMQAVWLVAHDHDLITYVLLCLLSWWSWRVSFVQIREEGDCVNRFKQLFAKVVLLAHDKYESPRLHTETPHTCRGCCCCFFMYLGMCVCASVVWLVGWLVGWRVVAARYRKVTTKSGLWTVATARRKFTRVALAKLWMTITSPDLRRETSSVLVQGFSTALSGIATAVEQLDLGITTGISQVRTSVTLLQCHAWVL